jgi:hypothetical protein
MNDNSSSRTSSFIDGGSKAKRKFKRRYITRSLWILTLISSCLFIMIFDEPTAVLLIATLILISGLVNLLTMFIHPRFFSVDGYILVILSYVLAFIKIILIPLDISVFFSFEEGSSNTFHYMIDLVWKVIYWTSIIVNFLILRVLLVYWQQGHPTVWEKLSNTFKFLFWQIMVIAMIGLLLGSYLLIKNGIWQTWDSLLFTINMINVNYCLLFVIILGAYGLVDIPFYFLTYTNTDKKLKGLLSKLDPTVDELVEAVNRFIKNKDVLLQACESVFTNTYECQELRSFAKQIEDELCYYRIDYNELVGQESVDPTIKISDRIDIDCLANMLIEVKSDFYTVIKREGALIRHYMKIDNNREGSEVEDIEKPRLVIYKHEGGYTSSDSGFNRFTDDSDGKSVKSYRVNSKSIKPRRYNTAIKIITKLVGVLLILVSLCILGFQVNIYFLNSINLIVNIVTRTEIFYVVFIFIYLYIGAIFLFCFFTMSQIRLFERYVLVKHHTDKLGMLYNAMMCNTFIIGVVYNLVYFFIDVYQNNQLRVSKALENIFKQILNQAPFVLSTYKTVFPSLFVFVVVVSVMIKFGVVAFIKKYLQIEDDEDVVDLTNSRAELDTLEKIEAIYIKDLK